ALNQAQAGLATAQQSMDEAQASLSQATREREAAEMLLSEARVHLAQAKTDKARTESELLAARTTLNQASVQFGKAHQSLSHTAEALNAARQQLSEAVTLHGQVNASLTQANSAQYQATSAIDRAQQQIHIARYAAWRQANTAMASHDTDYEYDARGRLVTERSAIVSYADVQKGQAVTQFVGRLTTRHSYDSLGNVIRTTTADGTRLQATQSFTFDVQGHQVQAEGLAGSQVVYNAKGLATININAEGHRRDRVYDALGQLRFEVDELGNVTEHRYNAYGDKTEQRRYAKAYSAAREAGRSLSLSALTQFTQQGGDWRQVSEAYNARGERIAVTQSSSVDAHTLSERTEFNRFGESVSVSKHYDGQLKAQVKHLYSVTGHRLASLNEENYVTLYGYNGHGELAEEKVFSNRYRSEWTLGDVQAWAQTQNSSMIMHRTSYEYDQRGHRHQVVRHSETFSVHDGDKVRYKTDDLITTTYHDYAGRLTMTVEEVGETDPTKHSTAANRMTQEYDALGRLVSTWGKARDYVVSGLAIAGQAERPERLSAHQRVDYLYDAQGNQVATLTEGRQSFQYFNAQGQLTGRENALGHYTKVETDQMNRVIRETTQVKVGEGLAYTHQRTTEYAYDATGRQTGTTVKVASGDITESAQYNAFGEVTEKRHNEAVQETHQYDGLGRVSQANRKGVEVTYEYDWQGLVTQEVTGGERTVRRRYDRVGNLTREETTAFGGQTRVTTQGFDRFGNVLSRVVNGQSTRFVYDHNRQVIRVTAPAVRKVDAAGVVSESASVTLMYYDVQGNRIAVQDANGHWQKSYYDVSGQKLMDVNGTGGETHYYHDAQGNQVARVNGAGQGEMFDYDAQGQLLSRSRLSADRAYAELYVRYAYDQVGQRYLEEWQGESGYRAYTHYDAAGRVTETQGEGTHRRYEYNTLGQKTAEHWLEDGAIKATKRAAYSATGRLTRETWLNGQVIQHEYDAQGRLIRKHGGGLDQRFEYDRSGLLAKQTVGSKSEVYQYDLHGRETRRELREGNHRLITESEWDALGRLRSIKAAEASAFGQSLTASEVRYDYDAVGNRRKVVTVKGSDTQTRWYHYDGDNRMVGSHTRTQDVATAAIGGHDGSRVITYNELGQKVKEVRWANTSRKVYYRGGQSQSRQELVKTETLTGYDQNGHLNQVNEFEYAGSQRVKTQEMHQRNARMGHALEQDTSRYEYRYWTSNGQPGAATRAVQSSLKDEKTTYYYWDGQLTSQHIASRSARNQSLRGQYDIHMTYHYSGQLSEQRTTNRKERVVDTQAYAYQATDAFRKSTLSVGTTRTAWGRSYRNGVTQFHYNPAGHLNRVTSTKSDSERQVLTDFNGQIALQLSGGQLSAELSSGGNPLAHVSDKIDADLMDEKASTVGQQPGSYTVSANDTLARIAQKVYGDSRYWYLLADANGVSPNTPLTEGKRLVVPNQHTQTFNGAESFKPYNESEVLGNITPDPIAPPPPPKSCSPVAMIVMAVVAVVVTVYTAGAAAPAIAGMTGAAAGSATGMAAVGAAALAGGASVGMHVGVAMGAAAIGGAMGSAASQLVGKAMGVVDDFSWGQVALGGLAAAASAGVGRYLSGGNVAAGQAASKAPAQSAGLMERFGDGLVRSTASYSSQYLGAKMLGEDASFSWTNFAASVVGNAASGEIKLSMGDNLPSDFVSGMVGASAVSVLRGESLRDNAGRFALDAFGNALGNVLVKGMAAQPSMPSRRPAPMTQGQSGARAATEPTVIVTPLGESERPIEWEEKTLYQRPDLEEGVVFQYSSNRRLKNGSEQEAQLQTLSNDGEVGLVNHFEHVVKGHSIGSLFGRSAIDSPYGTNKVWSALETTSRPSEAGPWKEGYIFPKTSALLSSISLVADWTSAGAQSSQIFIESLARKKMINMLDSSKTVPVNSLRIDYLKNVSTPLSATANTYAPITSAKSFEVLAKLNGTAVYSSLNVVSKYAPAVYATSQVGTELYYAVENDLSFETASINVGSRLLGTAVEYGGGLASFKAGAATGAPVGAFFGAFIGGLGAAPGALLGSAVGGIAGTLTYTFSGLGTTINNTVTDTTRDIIGWFNE
ncbi:LysM peptidoglycan-binding domain-containing protein, partial [Vibrio coralliilyticus]